MTSKIIEEITDLPNSETNQNIEDKVVEKIINKKRYFMYENIYDDTDKLLESFYFKIKPLEGIVTYKLSNWNNLPTTEYVAKKLAKDWSKKMIQNEKYNKFSVIIYFHLEYNTIRFELTEIIKLKDIKTIKEFEELIITKLEADKNIYLYNLENVEDFPGIRHIFEARDTQRVATKFDSVKFLAISERLHLSDVANQGWSTAGLSSSQVLLKPGDLNNSKELAKKWAELMEERLQNKKVIVLLNEYKKTVKLTFTLILTN
jgi:hypothetical protein